MINITLLGRIEYSRALAIQEQLHLLRRNEQIDDTLLLLEHEPVITLGLRGRTKNILAGAELLAARQIPVVTVRRGGDVTYHGPGQLVGYLIFALKNYGRDVRQFVARLESSFINFLKSEFALDSHAGDKEYTGVWVGNDKITAIGLQIRHAVTMHGFAFNINTELEDFKLITPCGLADRGVTSLASLLGRRLDFAAVQNSFTAYFARAFASPCRLVPLASLTAPDRSPDG